MGKIDQIWGPINIDHSAGKSMEELPAFEQIDPVNAESLGKWLVDNFMFDHFKKYSSTIPSSHKNGG